MAKRTAQQNSVEACAETLKMNLPSVHFLFCTLVTFFNAVEACGRDTSETQTQNGASVSQLQHKKSTVKLSHRYECTAAEKDSTACLNSGVCYAVDLQGNGDRSAFCNCVEKETGARCEQFVYTGQVVVAEAAFDYRLATIVVLSLAGLILAAIPLVVLVLKKRAKRKSSNCKNCIGDCNKSAKQCCHDCPSVPSSGDQAEHV